MADVDITSLSIEISAESEGAELNIEKLATALSKLKTKSEVGKTIDNLTKLTDAIEKAKSAAAGMSGIDQITGFIEKLSQTDASESVKSFNSLSNAIKKIASSTTTLNGTDFSALSGNLQQVTTALTPLSTLNVDNIKSIGSAFNALNKIPDLTAKLDSATLDSFADACNRISTALTPLASQLENVGNAFNQLPAKLKQVVSASNKVVTETKKMQKGYKSLSSSLNGVISSIKGFFAVNKIADYLANAIESFNDYYEAANYFGVAMKDLTGEASDFIDKMNELLGIDPTEAMNNMSKIQSLATSFGLASSQAYVLSKNLTQLGYDLSSLQNLNVDETFTKLQAAISGELEPIRRLGVDLSQARLQQELLELGFQQNISTLSQADKAVLRYIAIMKQTTDAQGDFARTIDSPANSLKVLKAQVEGLARAVGSVLYPALSAILPVAIATVEVVKEAVQSMAALVGVKVEFPDFSSVSDSAGALDSVTESAEEAKDALKGYSLGIDELNVINPNDSVSSGSGSTGNILGDIDLSKYEYDMFAEYVGNSVDEIKEKIKDILPIVEAIGISIGAWELSGFLLNLGEMLTKLHEASDAISAFRETVLGIGLIAIGATLEFTGIRDALEKGINDENLSEMITGALALVAGGALIADAITKWFADTAVANAIKQAGGSMGSSLVGACVAGVIAGVPMFVTGVIDALENGVSEANAKTLAFSGGLIGASIGGLIGGVPGMIIGAVVGIAGGLVTELCLGIAQYWDEITAEVKRLWDDFNGKVNESFTGFLQSVKDWLDGVKKKIDEKVEPFVIAMRNLLNAFSAENVARVITEWGTKLKEGFDSAIDKAKELINSNTLLSAGKDLIQGLINGVNSMIKSVVDTVGNMATNIIDKAKGILGINSPSKVFYAFGKYIDEGLANGIEAGKVYVENAMENLIDDVKEQGYEIIDYGGEMATGFVDGIANTLDSKWNEIDSGLKNDFFGTIENLYNVAKSGDVKEIGTTLAAVMWKAMGKEQQTQIKTACNDLVSTLTTKLKSASNNLADIAKDMGSKILNGITSNFDSIVEKTKNLGSTLTTVFKNVKEPLSAAAQAISTGLSGGLFSKFPEMFAGVASLITSIGGAFTAMLESIGAVLTGLGIPTGAIMLAAGVGLVAAIAGIVASLGVGYSSTSGSGSYDTDIDYSKVPGTSDYNSSNSYTSSSYGSSSGASAEEMRSAVYNGCYNAFLDIWQRYFDKMTDDKVVNVYIGGKKITSEVEKEQKERGVQIMGSEVYSY